MSLNIVERYWRYRSHLPYYIILLLYGLHERGGRGGTLSMFKIYVARTYVVGSERRAVLITM